MQSRAWLDRENKKEGNASPACETTTRFVGLWSYPLHHVEPGELYRISFWIKVACGTVKVPGQELLAWSGWAGDRAVRDIHGPSNAGD